ncbi:hypothetical protein BC936DRAFT_144479 [Jimgerdemannia flammicorona]|uniref:AN1-type domain-containing protein n=1 Tax=Jimgerdemannia flammicorona TaxID=994334 RepID=A0A433DCC4_9FUNG|nr:hypothetical protein BC936DRAFT_144479 [Jimgerdemannia flammicorona]
MILAGGNWMILTGTLFWLYLVSVHALSVVQILRSNGVLHSSYDDVVCHVSCLMESPFEFVRLWLSSSCKPWSSLNWEQTAFSSTANNSTSSPSYANFASKHFGVPWRYLNYVLQHRLPTDHKCELWEQANKNLQKCPTCNSFVFIPKHLGKETISTQETLELHLASACQNYVFSPSAKIEPVQCHLAGCGDVEKYVGGVKCEGCKEKFCLKHRSPLVHACSSLDALEVQKQRKRQAAQELLAQTFFKKTAADGTSAADLAKKAKAASTPRPVKGSRTVEVIKMKASARGDASIPQASRLYLHVRFPVEAGLPNKSMFMDKVGSFWIWLVELDCRPGARQNRRHRQNPEREQSRRRRRWGGESGEAGLFLRIVGEFLR